MSTAAASPGVYPSSGPVALGLAMGCLVLVLAASLTTCRLDKLIKPSITNRIAVTPDSLRASANAGSTAPRTVTLRITNADGGTLAWSATKTATWSSLSTSSGVAPDSLVVTLRADTLSQVPHQDTIVFTSAQANNTVRVPVSFDILPPAPELSVSPTSRADTAFAGSALPHTFTLRIDNTGSLPLTWSAAVDTGWLGLSKPSGGAPPRDSTVVTLTPGSLAPGTHSGTITVTAPGAIGSPGAVTVPFTINPCVETPVLPDAVVTGSISLSDCGAPQRAGKQAKLYSVQATAGDTLSFRLTSAAFDAYLVLTSSSGTLLDQNDACPGFVDGTACINFAVTVTGQYVVEATTAVAGATGPFSLSVVKELAPITPQAIGQFRSDSATAIGVGMITTENVVVFKGTLNDPNPGDSVRLMIELVGAISGTRTDSSAFVPVRSGGVPVAVRATGLVENEGYHWRARTCDKTRRCSAWLSFGGNPETVADFFVNAVPETPALASPPPDQFGPGGGAMPVGGGTMGPVGSNVTVTFKGGVTDPDPGDLISIEVEYKLTSAAFDGTSNLARGTGVSSGSTAGVAVIFGVPLLGTDNYHWRARACDQTNRCSAWVPFGGNSDVVTAATDFHVP